MYAIATVIEFFANLCRPIYNFQPAITRSSVRMVCQDFTFVGHKAVRDLGYQPIYSKEESVKRTVDYFRIHGPVT